MKKLVLSLFVLLFFVAFGFAQSAQTTSVAQPAKPTGTMSVVKASKEHKLATPAESAPGTNEPGVVKPTLNPRIPVQPTVYDRSKTGEANNPK